MNNPFRIRLLGLFLSLFILESCQKQWVPTVSYDSSRLGVSKDLTPEPKAEAFIAPYREKVEKQMNTVIGFVATPLEKGLVQSTLGNFVADLMKVQGEKVAAKSVDLSFVLDGGLRVPIMQGNVTVGKIFEVMPFDNELVILRVKGTTLQKLYDYAVRYKTASMANSSYVISEGKPLEIMIAGKPLNHNSEYLVMTSDYLANGGDNMFFWAEALSTEKTGLTVRDAIINQISGITAQGRQVESKLDSRVIIKN